MHHSSLGYILQVLPAVGASTDDQVKSITNLCGMYSSRTAACRQDGQWCRSLLLLQQLEGIRRAFHPKVTARFP
jgi:hypothetical protein